MDIDERFESVQKFRSELWWDRVRESHRRGDLCPWVSEFHPEHLPCQLANPDPYYGSYNVGLKFTFADSSAWLLRFPMIGRTHDRFLDEKVAMEVAAITLIRNHSTIPVPKIYAWGVAGENRLGLGSFIIMEFIEGGVGLNKLLRHSPETRLLKKDLSDKEVEKIYRQMANFMLQLFKLDFDRIGNLDSPNPELHFPGRPLTWKAHDILQLGGVDTFREGTFSSTSDYFKHVMEQDWEQLLHQANSAYGPCDAADRHHMFQVLKSLTPRFVHSEYDTAKFKFICDDLGLANLLVNNREELDVIGVVDLEWSYSGPAQLSGSAPWWLLMSRPTEQEWDSDQDAEIRRRYFKHLEIFKRVLEEEEASMTGGENKALSTLVHWSETSGAMWMHMLLASGFNHDRSFPFDELKRHVGADEWARLEKLQTNVNDDDDEAEAEAEAEAFGARKKQQLEQYEQDLEIVEEHTRLVEEGKMTKEDFLARHFAACPCPPDSKQRQEASI